MDKTGLDTKKLVLYEIMQSVLKYPCVFFVLKKIKVVRINIKHLMIES